MSKVKICGLSRMDDIAAVNRVLPDYVGFVFAPSRRRVDMMAAAKLKERLDPAISTVGVYVNEDIGAIVDMLEKGIIDVVQLHGDEDAQYMTGLKNTCGCTVIKAISIGDSLPADLPSLPDYLLFDALSHQRGGIGKSFDWNVLLAYSNLPYFLAGGLDIHNITHALTLLSPYCVDVSSGVETGGLKDDKKIEEFVNTVREISK